MTQTFKVIQNDTKGFGGDTKGLGETQSDSKYLKWVKVMSKNLLKHLTNKLQGIFQRKLAHCVTTEVSKL